MWKTIVAYGLALAAGVLLLAWLNYSWLVRGHAFEVYAGLIATAFLALGVWVGARVFRRPVAAAGFERNTTVMGTLGISERELEVLELLAAGRSNKEIAGKLNVSPNTVKTHVAKLYGKLEVTRRTEAVSRARELGVLP